MRSLGHGAQWVFALVVSVIAYFAAMFVCALLILRVTGLPSGTPPSAGYQFQGNLTVLGAVANATLFVPLIASAYFGAITAPNAQRGVALVAFPLLVFLVFNAIMTFSGKARGFDIRLFFESGAACAAVGVFLSFGWRRHKARQAWPRLLEDPGPSWP